MRKYKIGFDMDKVLTDFDKAYKQQWKETQQFPQAGARFFDELDLLFSNEIANIEYVKKLSLLGHDVRIITAPSIPNINCWTGKAVWIQRYFGQEFLKKVVMTYDKAIASRYVDILVDDSTKNGQLAFGDGLITYGSEKYPDMKSVFDQINEWSKEDKIFNR